MSFIVVPSSNNTKYISVDISKLTSLSEKAIDGLKPLIESIQLKEQSQIECEYQKREKFNNKTFVKLLPFLKRSLDPAQVRKDLFSFNGNISDEDFIYTKDINFQLANAKLIRSLCISSKNDKISIQSYIYEDLLKYE